MENCGRCGSSIGVKLNQHQLGLGSEHEFLCRACRFDVSNIRRTQSAQNYIVRGFVNGRIEAHTHYAATAMDAVQQAEEADPDFVWFQVDKLSVVRRRDR